MIEEQNLWQEDQTSRDLKFYFATAKRPLTLSLGLIFFFYLLSIVSFLDWTKTALDCISWIIILLTTLVVSFRVATKRYQELAHAATAAALIGWMAGAWHVLLQTIWFWSWWRIVNIIVEPVIISVVGLLIGVAVAKLFQIKNKVISPEINKVPAAKKKTKKYDDQEGGGTNPN